MKDLQKFPTLVFLPGGWEEGPDSQHRSPAHSASASILGFWDLRLSLFSPSSLTFPSCLTSRSPSYCPPASRPIARGDHDVRSFVFQLQDISDAQKSTYNRYVQLEEYLQSKHLCHNLSDQEIGHYQHPRTCRMLLPDLIFIHPRKR